MKRVAAAGLLVCIAASVFAQEVANPFTARGAHPSEGFFHSVTSNLSAFVANAMAPIQKTLNESLAAITRSLQGSRSVGGLLFVVFISLVYGIFHAAGPGHGKTIVSSFFLANDAKLRHSVAIGYLIAGVHSLAALTVVLVLYYLVRGLFSVGIEQANHYIQLATFGVIAVLGAFMLVGRIRGTGHHHLLPVHAHNGESAHDHDGDFSHDADHRHGHDHAGGVTFKSLLGIAVPAGVIPCPGAVAVILFALSLHMLGVSVLSVVSISLGMGVTISVTGALVILAKQGTLKALAAGHGERESLVRRVVEIGGAAVLFLFGLMFFLAQL
jgi:ABC-type nickel/cobalt efflux system permease component RcnA